MRAHVNDRARETGVRHCGHRDQKLAFEKRSVLVIWYRGLAHKFSLALLSGGSEADFARDGGDLHEVLSLVTRTEVVVSCDVRETAYLIETGQNDQDW